MKYSIQDLLVSFIDKGFSVIKKTDMERIIIKITEALNNGSNYNDINKAIITTTERIVKRDTYDRSLVNQICNRFFSSITNSRSNLIKTGTMYYHNELRLVPGPVKAFYDIYTCETTYVKEDYFLEIVCSYTMEDLINYMKKKESFKKAFIDDSRTNGQVKYILERNNYNIDLVLFLVDTIDDIYMDKKKYIKNFFELNDYIEEATDNYNGKKTAAKENESDVVVFKNRTTNCKIL